MERFARVRRSNDIPLYLSQAGVVVEEKRLRREARSTIEIQNGFKEGRLKTAQFKENVEHVEHRFGIYEEAHTGAIWESGDDGYIYRREDAIVKPVLQAIADSPDMTDEEYAKKIEEIRAQHSAS